MERASHAAALLFALLGCSSTTGSGPSPPCGADAGSACAVNVASDGSVPSARAFVQAELGASRDMAGNNLCSVGSAFRTVFVLGTATGPAPVKVNDGDTSAGGTADVRCTVRGAFDVSLSATLGGAQGGALQATGHVDATSGGQGIAGLLTAQGATYGESDCTVAFTYAGASVPATPPVAAGRIWAHLSCPKMPNQDGHVVKLSDGTSVAETCDAEVDFVFENCSQ